MGTTSEDNTTLKSLRIGLALSGGGFRASIFHLGVIRRLEELGIMKYVNTISAVSGGSIIAAYYVIEMEKRLRQRRKYLKKNPCKLDKVRLQIFKKIAGDFFKALDHNLRSRAMVFSPFYHPIPFLKSLWPSYSRSDLMQKEYDKWFYHNNTLDHLPAVTLRDNDARSEKEKVPLFLTGPEVILNATSLLTGERKSFKREQVSPLKELHRVNQNTLKLSRVVGASSGVPGVFPPTPIWGDKFVDGGVADNQGLDALISLDRSLDVDKTDTPDCDYEKNAESDCDCDKNDAPDCDCDCDCDKNDTSDCDDKKNVESNSDCDKTDTRDCDDFDVLLVSDASGQMEPVHRQSNRALKILFRVATILQFQLRRKMVKLLRFWQRNDDSGREFAFVHLFLNLKGRKNKPRVPSEYIPALGGIRTDLDQFSFIEREVLMYHGYTLIDAQIRKYCKTLKACICKKTGSIPKLSKPPLFGADCSDQATECASETKRRKRVQNVLEAGSSRSFLNRSRRKYRWKSWLIFAPALLLLLEGWSGCVGFLQYLWDFLKPLLLKLLELLSCLIPAFVMPDWAQCVLDCVAEICCFPCVTLLLNIVVWIGPKPLWLYVIWFLTYVVMRRMVRRWDLKDYQSLTCQDPTLCWTTNDDSSEDRK